VKQARWKLVVSMRKAIQTACPGVALVLAVAVAMLLNQDRGATPSLQQHEAMSALCAEDAKGHEQNPQSEQYFNFMPEIIAVLWGQAKGSYAYPPERLVLCGNGRGAYLWSQDSLTADTARRPLMLEETTNLFDTLLKVWPHGRERRGNEEGNFLWILDSDFNVIVAPVMQDWGDGRGVQEVKHGDLCPGVNFFGENSVAGRFRGVARLGGEFDLAGERDGSEWVMHTRSGYTAFRAPISDAKAYHDTWHSRGHSEAAIGANLEACVMSNTILAQKPLAATLCHLHRQHSVAVHVTSTRRCNISGAFATMPGFGGLPNMTSCKEEASGALLSSVCGPVLALDLHTREAASPRVHLVDWYSDDEEAKCTWTRNDLGRRLEEINVTIMMHSETRHSQAMLKALWKHVCFSSADFIQQFTCNLHGCFGDGLTPRLKATERALADGLHDVARAEWAALLSSWQMC